jgi:hypothetical protein
MASEKIEIFNNAKNTIMELIKNNFYTIQLRGRENSLCGILIHSGIEWILLRYIPVDYVLDGYLLIRKKYIKKIIREENEIFNESVIHIKYTAEKRFDEIERQLDEITHILYYLMHREIIIQFDFSDDRVCYIGKIKKLYTKTMRVQNLDPRGNWEDESSYLFEQTRTIQFDNDYINSLIAYNKWLNNKILLPPGKRSFLSSS